MGREVWRLKVKTVINENGAKCSAPPLSGQSQGEHRATVMIIIALFGALVFYVALYCLWAASSEHLVGMQSWLRVLNDAAFMPGNTVFVLLRGLIIITAFYVFADFLRAAVRKQKRRRAEAKRAREEPFALIIKDMAP